ncbi:tol-pal system protein YbgF [Labrys monachus]|uniref:Cell division coordinator CpoB n=1 Tax=Labrys monachus TaxID=217067 RepID=A0ABU0F894_9HYPH|nr:tol-pal system protein YbgF [Labrys monachus]MDQ0390838.1 tol-pal system protein YbgF [Labrys monachus]
MLRSASAALLLALTLGAAHAASPDDGLLPPGSVGSAQNDQDQYGQDKGGQAYDQPQYGQSQYDQAPSAQPPTYQVSPARSNYVVAQNDSQVGDLLVRVQRLEGDNRRLNGMVDDLQAQIRKLQDDMKRAQDDTEYRLQALEGGKGGAAPAPRPAPQAPPAQVPRQQRSDAAPPRQQNGLGTPPRTLGTLSGGDQTGTAGQDPGQDQMSADQGGDDLQAPPPPRQRMNSSTITPGLPGVAVDTSRPLASNEPAAGIPPTAAATPEEEYNNDYRLIAAQKYEQAESAFRGFVEAHPRDKRVPDAIHWIGESLYQRRQYSDAAEQFIKVTKTYANSRRAPSSMLKLGMSLAAIGEKDTACATLLELPRKYPKAGPSILNGASREAKRNSCPGT